MHTRSILFTGAGFTANWGGFLNNEMWSQIFNQKEIQNSEKIRSVLLGTFDFELALEIIQNNPDYGDIDKGIMWHAVDIAFEKLDSVIKDKGTTEPEAKLQDVRQFIKDILGRRRGFFFTLNQDLFVERFLFGPARLRPGIIPENPLPIAIAGIQKLAACKAPSKEEIEHNGNRYLQEAGSDNVVYIKLHGSQDWKGSFGLRLKVIGGGKRDVIEREPILRFYFETFVKILSEKNSRILIIGYGFRDEHVNRILIDSIKNHGLRVFVVSPLSPEDFRDTLAKNQCYEIWKGLSSYYPRTLRDLLASRRSARDVVDSLLFGI